MNKRPRILYILHNPVFFRCGTEIHTRALFDGLRGKYDTWVAFLKDDQILLTCDGKNAYPYPADRLDRGSTPFSASTTTRSLKAIISKVDPDLIHIQHIVGWPLNVIDISVGTRQPVIMSMHDYYAITPAFKMAGVSDPDATLSAEYSVTTFGKDISAYLQERRTFLSESLRGVERIVVPSQYLSNMMSTIFPYVYRVIPHGIPEFQLSPGTGNTGKTAFGYFGHLVQVKGYELLTHAFSMVKGGYPNSELHFFGNYKQAPLESPGVVYHGAYDQSDLPEILSGIDVVVIPSLFAETFCLVLSEAWMAGLPVAVSDIGALGERVTDGVDGKKFRAGDVKSLIDALSWFLVNESWKSWNIQKPKTSADMVRDYDNLYQSFLS